MAMCSELKSSGYEKTKLYLVVVAVLFAIVFAAIELYVLSSDVASFARERRAEARFEMIDHVLSDEGQ